MSILIPVPKQILVSVLAPASVRVPLPVPPSRISHSMVHGPRSVRDSYRKRSMLLAT